MKPVLRKQRATADIRNAAKHYATIPDTALARRFVEAVDVALAHIGQHPGTGSPRYSSTLTHPGLRFWTLKRFPYAVFYVERTDHIEVLRVLHQSSDIPGHLQP